MNKGGKTFVARVVLILVILGLAKACFQPGPAACAGLEDPGITASPGAGIKVKKPKRPKKFHSNKALQPEAAPSRQGSTILKTGERMAVIDKEILIGGCWDYADAVYNRAGFPEAQRSVIFKGDKDKGPYADISLVRPGDWLYYINHRYGEIEHSAIFVHWVNYDKKKGLMLSYGGENRQEPARYMDYGLNKIFCIIRPKGRSKNQF